jgi:hypothetical protein
MKTFLVTEFDPTGYDVQWPDSSENFLNFDLPRHFVHLFKGDMLN